jgi:uncharacterized membrane protein
VSTDDKALPARMVAMPTPPEAAQWEQVCPGSFDRIMCEIETEERHRRRTEVIEQFSRVFGQLCGFGTVIVLAMLAKYFADRDAPTQGAAIIVSGAGTLVAIFVTGKLLRNR